MILAWIVAKVLRFPLSLRAKTYLLCAILERIEALPLKESIEVRNSQLYIRGKVVTFEQAAELRESARAMLMSTARKTVRDHVSAIAAKRGIVEGDTPEKLYFYRAALWWAMTEEELYTLLAGGEDVV